MGTDRLGRLYWAGGAAIVFGCLGLGLFLIVDARSDYLQQKAAGEALSRHHLAMRVTHAISSERAISTLSAIDPDPQTARIIAIRRQRTDADIRDLKRMLAQSFALQEELHTLMPRLEQRLAAARSTVDSVVALSIDQREQSQVAGMVAAMFAACDLMSNLRDQIGQAVIKSAPEVATDVLLLTTASTLREQGGRLASSVVLFLAPEDKHLAPSALREFDEATGRIAILLSSLGSALGPAFRDRDVELASAEMRNLFVATSMPLAAQIMRGGSSVAYTPKSFADAFIPGLYAIERVFEAVVKASRHRIDARRDAARRSLIWAAVPTGIALAICLAVVAVFRRRVFQPLAGAQEQLEAIARGDLSHASFKQKVAGELQDLFPALALVRDNQLRLEHDQQRISDQFDRLSETDPLTGKLNRVTFIRRAKRVIETAAVRDIAVAVVVFDIDGLKWVNNAGGYVAGDEMLGKIATELTCFIGDRDLFARYGGDEFAILFAVADRCAAVKTVEAMRKHVEASLVTSNGSVVTASFGMAFRAIDSGIGLEQMMATAERRLAGAKAGGRNRVCAGDEDAPATKMLTRASQPPTARGSQARARSTRR